MMEEMLGTEIRMNYEGVDLAFLEIVVKMARSWLHSSRRGASFVCGTEMLGMVKRELKSCQRSVV